MFYKNAANLQTCFLQICKLSFSLLEFQVYHAQMCVNYLEFPITFSKMN